MMYMLITVRRRFAVLSAHVVDMGKPIEKEFFLVEKKRFLPGGF
ncbi:MAG: hypothetical protein ACLUIQ_08900 [Dialister invisus]